MLLEAKNRFTARNRLSQPGTTFWITGLSGAGKSSVGRLLWQRLRAEGRFAIFLDGDRLRDILGGHFGYGRQDRIALGYIYADLCRELTDQGADVVCATVAMFEEIRDWNRRNLVNYREIYLRVSPEVLSQRNQKGFYVAAAEGQTVNVPGLDQPFEEPRSPDVVIDNDGARAVETIAAQLYLDWAARSRAP